MRGSRRFPCPWDSDTSGLGWGLCRCRFGNPAGDGCCRAGDHSLRRAALRSTGLKEKRMRSRARSYVGCLVLMGAALAAAAAASFFKSYLFIIWLNRVLVATFGLVP